MDDGDVCSWSLRCTVTGDWGLTYAGAGAVALVKRGSAGL